MIEEIIRRFRDGEAEAKTFVRHTQKGATAIDGDTSLFCGVPEPTMQPRADRATMSQRIVINRRDREPEKMANPSIQILDETVHRADLQHIVVDDLNGMLTLAVRLQDGTVLYVRGVDARETLRALVAPEFGLAAEAQQSAEF